MDSRRIQNISAVISYIEAHLNEKLDLDAAARAACYSKFHLHRMFRNVAGLTLHDYVRRRQLTEAAKQLVFSEKPVLEIALAAGYESQQAFTDVFKAMYKQTPGEYRRRGFFYPLQLKFTLVTNPLASGVFPGKITYAALEDLPDWMEFVSLVIDGFPCLEEAQHMAQVRRYIEQRQMLMIRDGAAIIGAAAFSERTGSIGFLAVHPQYRRCGAARALLTFMRRNLFAGREISITTFREGDKADMGQRAAYERLGFAGAELLTEFGYPVQRMVLPPKGRKGSHEG